MSKQTKGKKGKGGKKAELMMPPPKPIGVRESLVWFEGKDKEQAEDKENKEQELSSYQPQERFLPRKAEIGKAKSRGYELPDEYDMEHLQSRHCKKQDGHVIDALRGWTRDREDAERMNWDRDNEYLLEYYADDYSRSNTGKNKGGKSKKGGKDSGKGSRGGKEGDPQIGELMAHKFLNDFQQQREEEQEKEREAAEAKARSKSEAAHRAMDHSDIKGTKTSQLRSLHLATKVEVAPKDLWQMPKFTKKAQPHLNTHRKKGEYKSGGDMNGYASDDDVPICVCMDNA